MAKIKAENPDKITVLYNKMGRASYVLAQAEATLLQAQQAHKQLQQQVVGIANEIAQAEKKGK